VKTETETKDGGIPWKRLPLTKNIPARLIKRDTVVTGTRVIRQPPAKPILSLASRLPFGITCASRTKHTLNTTVT